MKVKAKLKGFYGGRLREPGDVFDCEAEGHFSAAWMEAVKEPQAEDAAPKPKRRLKAESS